MPNTFGVDHNNEEKRLLSCGTENSSDVTSGTAATHNPLPPPKRLKTNFVFPPIDNSTQEEGCIFSRDLYSFLVALENPRIETSIKELSLNGSGIDDSDAIRLAEALMKFKNNNSLISIDLSNNRIGSTGAQALGRMLRSNVSLLDLDLRNNTIGPRGAIALGKALETNFTLTTIYLSYNHIGDVGAQAFLESMAYNATLTWVGRLYGSDLTDDALRGDIMDVVSENNNENRNELVQTNRAKRVFPTLLLKSVAAKNLAFELQKKIWEVCFGEIDSATNIRDYPKDLKRLLLWQMEECSKERI